MLEAEHLVVGGEVGFGVLSAKGELADVAQMLLLAGSEEVGDAVEIAVLVVEDCAFKSGVESRIASARRTARQDVGNIRTMYRKRYVAD